jgi:hypothetical protein
MTDKTADLIKLITEKCIKPMPCLCDACFADVPTEEWTTEPMFPPVVRAETMHRECVRDGWIMGEHPVRYLRGNDHE